VETTPALALALLGRRRCRWGCRVTAALRLLAAAYLIALAALVAATLLPVLIGWRPYLISSGSVQPDVPAGSVVLADRDGTLSAAVGDVVLVHDPARPGSLLAHRVAAVRPDGGLITKGDANAGRDTAPVPPASVVGRVRAVVPMLGTVERHRGQCALLALLAGLLIARSRRRLRTRRLPRALVAATAVAALTSALAWQATAASPHPAPARPSGPTVRAPHR